MFVIGQERPKLAVVIVTTRNAEETIWTKEGERLRRRAGGVSEVEEEMKSTYRSTGL